jgi:hypothetical protein
MGTDYFAHTAVKKLLAADGIRYSERPPADYMLFPASFRASAVYVSSNDLAPARLLIDARFLERDEDDEQLKVNGPDGSEVEKAPEDDDDTSAVPPDVAPTVPEDWNSRLATCTIWRTDLIEAM